MAYSTTPNMHSDSACQIDQIFISHFPAASGAIPEFHSRIILLLYLP